MSSSGHLNDKIYDTSQINDRDVFIIAALRSPIGTYGGALSPLTAPQLASQVINAAISVSNISVKDIDEVILGNVLQSNIGQNPARQASLYSNIPIEVPCTTVNKVCSSGLKAIQFGSQSIELGHNDIVIAGGMESMSNAPYYLTDHRFGARMGNKTIIDGMIKDGLWCFHTDQHMGSCAEHVAKEYKISRKEQDDFSILSYKRAINSINNNIFNKEIIPIKLPNDKIIYNDEGCGKFDENKLRTLKPAFDKNNGTITAGNASQISDGAAIVILCSGKKIKLYNNNNDNNNKIKPLCKILSYADAEQNPINFPLTPSIAIPKAMKRINMDMNILNNHDYFEINEAFSIAPIINCKLLNININQCNILGGSLALGHPLGCSGARIIVTLINTLFHNNGRYGIAGVCNGGGGASAMIIAK